MMFWQAAISALFMLCIGTQVRAQDAQSEAAQRQQIQQQRQQIEADSAKRQLACRDQFVVTGCLEKARIDKQEALHLLRERELAMDAAKREQRATEQAARVADKAQAAAQKESQASAPAGAEEAALAASRPQKPPRKASSIDKNKPRPSSSAASHSASEEQHKRDQFNARQREIQAHREAVEQRNAKRSAQRQAKPLPVPAGASDSGR
jgi:hypothetical protein